MQRLSQSLITSIQQSTCTMSAACCASAALRSDITRRFSSDAADQSHDMTDEPSEPKQSGNSTFDAMNAALDAAEEFFKGRMPPCAGNKPMNYLRAKELARAIDMELDPDLRLCLGHRPKLTPEADMKLDEFISSLKPALMKVCNIESEEEWKAYFDDAMSYSANREAQYNLQALEQGEPVFDGGTMGGEQYLTQLVESNLPLAAPPAVKKHIRTVLKSLLNNPRFTMHAKEHILRRMLVGLAGVEVEGGVGDMSRDQIHMDAYQSNPDLIDKLERDIWVEEREGSSKPTFNIGYKNM